MEAEELKNIVKEKYGRIAEQNEQAGSCCEPSCCGPSCCGPEVDYTVFSESYAGKEGYNPDADMNLGCGIPTDFAGIRNGDHVLDLGSGAGNDCFVARALTGETGRVTGLDMTEPMIRKARANCEKLGLTNVEFVQGDIEEMPFKAGIFDVVISNCVLNLVPDKIKAFSEIYRVLKPGGHFCVSDVVTRGDLTEEVKKDAEMYAGCVSGASKMEDYLKIIDDSGFIDVRVHKQKVIRVPGALMSGSGDEGIFSITVTGHRK